MGGVTNRMRVERAREDASTTPLELFFDLVFVFALTQTTAVIADDLSAHGIVRGLLIFGLLWWSWVCYAWSGNVVRADEGVIRLAMVAAMATMFVLALGIPEAFDDLAGGLAGPVVVAACYFVFRAIHLFKVRTLHTFTRARATTGIGLLVLIPAGWQMSALATLALLSATVVGLVVWETTTIADTRYRIRHEQG
ncbi:MAG: low temperature requirement protein A [Actinomycetota bacterium]|nr:low temperature requirement protein A [Actinomycetota bacterium]